MGGVTGKREVPQAPKGLSPGPLRLWSCKPKPGLGGGDSSAYSPAI